MTTKNDGGPAFPLQGQKVDFGNGWIDGQTGMSLRDYFAAKAMQALSTCGVINIIDPEKERSLTFAELTATRAYQYADAMLKEREK